MNTPSHWLMTVVAGKLIPGAGQYPRMALGLGSIAPDLPLYGLSLGGIWYFSRVRGWEQKQVFEHLFDHLYFNDPIWISLHNFLHSPTMLLILFGLTLLVKSRLPKFSRWCCFFLGACAFHSVVDILTHNGDGPVLFFPFDLTYRFTSPVSYWDPNHYGSIFMVFETVLDLGLIAWLVMKWRKRARQPHEALSG